MTVDISEFFAELAHNELKRSFGDKDIPSLHKKALQIIDKHRQKLDTYKLNLEREKSGRNRPQEISMWKRLIRNKKKYISILEQSIPVSAKIVPEINGNVYHFDG